MPGWGWLRTHSRRIQPVAAVIVTLGAVFTGDRILVAIGILWLVLALLSLDRARRRGLGS